MELFCETSCRAVILFGYVCYSVCVCRPDNTIVASLLPLCGLVINLGCVAL